MDAGTALALLLGPTGDRDDRRGRKRLPSLVALALAAATGACDSPAARGAEGEIVLRRFTTAWERADTAELLELFWPHAVYDDFPNQATYRGPEEIVGYVTGVHAWASDVVVNVTGVHVGDAAVVGEWIFAAVQDRPIADRVPVATGREVVLNGVTILELERGRIVRAADYIDTAPLFLQLGGSLELPGGRTITLDDVR